MAKKFRLGKWLKRLFYLLLFLFISCNFVMYNHAYHFTHFVDKDLPKITAQVVHNKSLVDKIKLGILGVEIPKSQNKVKPDSAFQEVSMGKHPRLHAWWIPTTMPVKGVMILFHGYSASKSSHLERARVLRKLGYHTFLVDFRGHGDSEGFQTSIGYHEAEDVKTAYQYIRTYYGDLEISLLGSSMGAVSILKAVHDYQLNVQKLILECPFGSIKDAVYNRFENMNIPRVLLPEMLLFWSGVQNNMSCWEHNAATYASKVSHSTLIIHGKKDEKVRQHEVDAILKALAGPSQLEVLENAGHDRLMADDPKAWTQAVWGFLVES